MSDRDTRGDIRQRIVDDYAGHKLYDERGERIGKVEYTILDAEGMPEYLAVKTGWFGSNTTLIPEGIARPGDGEFEIQASEDRIKDAPTFGDEGDVTSSFEDRVREHFGLGGSGASGSAAAGSSGSSSESRDRDRGDTRSDTRDRDLGDDDRRGESRSESRSHDDRDRGERENRPSEARSGADEGDQSGYRDAAAAGGAAGGIARDKDRGESRGDESRGGDRSSSGSRSGGEREKVKVTVKREKAIAERIRGEDGQEEVRIRKEMVEEEEMVEVEDRL